MDQKAKIMHTCNKHVLFAFVCFLCFLLLSLFDFFVSFFVCLFFLFVVVVVVGGGGGGVGVGVVVVVVVGFCVCELYSNVIDDIGRCSRCFFLWKRLHDGYRKAGQGRSLC